MNEILVKDFSEYQSFGKKQKTVKSESLFFKQIIKKLKSEISLKDQAIKTASNLIKQLKQQLIYLQNQYIKFKNQTELKQIYLTNKINVLVQQHQTRQASNRYDKTNQTKNIQNSRKLSLQNKSRDNFSEKKLNEKQKLKIRFKNYINISQIQTKNDSLITPFEDVSVESKKNSYPKKIEYFTTNQQILYPKQRKNQNINLSFFDQPQKKNIISFSDQFLFMMNQIKQLKESMYERDQKIIEMAKQNKVIEQQYANIMCRLNK